METTMTDDPPKLDPDSLPLFMRGNPDSEGGPNENDSQDQGPSAPLSWDDKVLGGGGTLTATYKKVAKLLAEGQAPAAIATTMGYSVEKVQELSKHAGIQAEIDRILDVSHAEDPTSRLKDMAHEALDTIENLMRDYNVPATKKADLARWIIEKVDGKAAQKIDVGGGVNIGVFLDKLDQIKTKQRPVIDVGSSGVLPEGSSESQAEEKATQDSLDAWLDSNLD